MAGEDPVTDFPVTDFPVTDFKDHFSRQAAAYARHRPRYPDALFAYLASIVDRHEIAWDCGTGNGQAALGLARHFRRVIATDPSLEQIRNAVAHPRIGYRVESAENPCIDARSIDLVTVAQALHWFERDAFYHQVNRVLKPGGALAIWCYSLFRVSAEIDRITEPFCFETLRPYWPPEREFVDHAYRSIAFPFSELSVQEFSNTQLWDLSELIAYVGTWSATVEFVGRNGYDPTPQLAAQLLAVWGDPGEKKPIRWPLHLRVGRPK
jgi:ubiquinone/menaquinone biosynthesis C-methylase UbiE